MSTVPRPLHAMDSRQLLAFVTVAKARSFTRAGKELFLTQSAVSHALKALEHEVNCRLIDRKGKQFHLTPAGEHLLHYAEKIITDMSSARESLNQRAKWGKGRLRVGSSPSVCQYLLPGVLSSFRAEFPEWPMSVDVGDTRECVEWLRQGRIDLAIAMAPSCAEPVEIVPLFVDELMWIVPPNHPWLKRGVIREEIPDQSFICSSTASYTFRLLEKHFQREGIRPKLDLELGSLETIKEMIKRGLGVTITAPWVMRKEIGEQSVAALPLGKRKLKRHWCVLRSLDRKAGLAEETFMKLCLKSAESASLPNVNENLQKVTADFVQL